MSSLVRTSNSVFFDNLYRDTFHHLLTWEPVARTTTRAAFFPRFNIVEKDDGYHISADLPGLSEDDLEVTVHEGTLTVAGKRESEEPKENETWFVCERSGGEFKRMFSLPENADAESIGASLKNGVLNVVVGKRPEAQPRKIALK